MQKRTRPAAALCGAELFALGGTLYMLVELLWRGYTHWSMCLVGGACFCLIGGIHTALKGAPLALRCVACAAAITAVEFGAGCLFNLCLGWQVWDYSMLPLNLCGQVCLRYSGFWGVLSLAALPVYRQLSVQLRRSSGFFRPPQRPSARSTQASQAGFCALQTARPNNTSR